MRFAYTYRSSDGQRHTAEIEAPSRDAAFEAIRRERGVKPIKVTAAETGAESAGRGSGAKSPSVAGKILLLSAGLALAIIGGGVAWRWAARRDASPYQFTVNTPQGPVTYTGATPLPRQAIPGDRARIEAARETAFRSPAEAWLARFAEPGRAVENGLNRAERAEGREDSDNPARSTRSARLNPPAHEDFVACLKEPTRIASTDFTEVVDLKRIVTGMKRELGAYLSGGGTVQQYLAELVKRQRLEISYRERAEQKLNELLADSQKHPSHSSPKATEGSPSTLNPQLSTAYSYWLKANAQLKAMGIYELPLPDILRRHQMSLDLDE